jgi:membrane protease YdiL (CAAX protease family)
VLAWLVILGLAGTTIGLSYLRPVQKIAAGKDQANLLVLEVQGRYLVGLTSFMGQKNPQIVEQIRMLNSGSIAQRLHYVVLAGELAGPPEALEGLQDIERTSRSWNIPLGTTEEAIKQDLEHLYRDYNAGRLDAPSLSQQDRDFLRSELGWFGQLALAPAGGPNTRERDQVIREARITLAVIFAAGMGGLLLAVAGLAALVVLSIYFATGRARSRLDLRQPNGGIYAETFAVWLLLFLGYSILAGLVAPEGYQLSLAGIAMLLSLSALAWPVLRGVPWRTVRWEIGWHGGKHPLVEIPLGLAAYAMSLPILVGGVLVMVVLVFILQHLPGRSAGTNPFAPSDTPSHPIMEVISKADFWMIAQLLFLASVVAPLVEETMFRGVLHRHLREATGRWGGFLSFLVSAAIVSFLFAAVHPQGFVAIPPLMALALGFSIAREWRGSLLAPMVAHGLHNGALLIMVFSALSG